METMASADVLIVLRWLQIANSINNFVGDEQVLLHDVHPRRRIAHRLDTVGRDAEVAAHSSALLACTLGVDGQYMEGTKLLHAHGGFSRRHTSSSISRK